MRFDVSVILRTAVPILLGLVLGAAFAAAAGAAALPMADSGGIEQCDLKQEFRDARIVN